jgi:hypothetical protein
VAEALRAEGKNAPKPLCFNLRNQLKVLPFALPSQLVPQINQIDLVVPFPSFSLSFPRFLLTATVRVPCCAG